MILAAAPGSTIAGIAAAIAGVVTALGGLLVAVGVLIPLLKETRATNKAVDSLSEATVLKLDQIHTLVNSDMTAARQAELDQTRVSLAVLRRVVAMDVAAGRPSTDEDMEAIEVTEGRIRELQAILADRLVQQQAVEAEAHADRLLNPHPSGQY